MLPTAFRPSCMNRASVFECHKRLREGRESVRDDERCGRSKAVNFMDKDRRVSIETISAQIYVNVVHSIIREELKMRKIYTKFAPRVLREDQKERRCRNSREMVELINSVLDALMTCDESRICCYDLETEFSVEACWLFQTQECQTEQFHPQTFDDPFFERTCMICMHCVPTGQSTRNTMLRF